MVLVNIFSFYAYSLSPKMEKNVYFSNSFPEQLQRLRKFNLWYAVMSLLPWLIIGIGILSDEYRTVFDLLNFNIGFWGYLFWSLTALGQIVFAAYIFMFNGAQTLTGSGLISPTFEKFDNPRGWKIVALWGLILLLLVIGLLYLIRDTIQIDLCLDAGFSWDYIAKKCKS